MIQKIRFKNFAKKYKLPYVFIITFGVIILYSIFVRGQGLGYSNFQGDEVNPMDFLYEMKEGLLQYLFSQKRGPIQYIINIINVSLFGYHNEFLIRLPFLIFGILALFTVYKLAQKIFNKSVALTAVVLMAINGLFIAFSRITQYQSFMYFLIPIGVLVFIKGIEKKDNAKMLISGLIVALALLAHYDTLSVFPFFIVSFAGLIFRELSQKQKISKSDVIITIKSYLKPFVIFFISALIPAIAYYVPFYLGQAFESTTSGYLATRLFGGGFMPRTRMTADLLAMYIPRFHMYGLFAFGILGIAFWTTKLSGYRLGKFNIKDKFVKASYVFFVFMVFAGSVFSFFPIKPRMSSLIVIGSALAICAFLTFAKKLDWKKAALATWFLGAYSFYFFIMKDPRTHVYVSIIPLFILAGYGIMKVYYILPSKIIKYLYLALLSVTFVVVCVFNWVVFVDRSPEYPWWDKDYLGMPVYRIERVRHKKIEGVFGFNNYRAWDQVADLYKRGCLKGDFNSNEKDAITYFYIREHQKKGAKWELTEDSDNLIIVEGPHSWMYYNYNETKIPDNYVLLKTIKSNGIPVSYIFGRPEIYPNGKLMCE